MALRSYLLKQHIETVDEKILGAAEALLTHCPDHRYDDLDEFSDIPYLERAVALSKSMADQKCFCSAAICIDFLIANLVDRLKSSSVKSQDTDKNELPDLVEDEYEKAYIESSKFS